MLGAETARMSRQPLLQQSKNLKIADSLRTGETRTMAPASRTESTKHITLHNFLKQQHLLQQRLKPAAVLWSWPVPRPTPDDATDDADGASWPPRSYTCAFCRREFRSAQALGGHMNVHRRDRAKLRGQYGATPPAAEASAPAAVATTEYAVLYPVLNSNAAGARAVYMPNGDVLLSAPVALASSAAHGLRCHIGSDDENAKDIDLELRLGWP